MPNKKKKNKGGLAALLVLAAMVIGLVLGFLAGRTTTVLSQYFPAAVRSQNIVQTGSANTSVSDAPVSDGSRESLQSDAASQVNAADQTQAEDTVGESKEAVQTQAAETAGETAGQDTGTQAPGAEETDSPVVIRVGDAVVRRDEMNYYLYSIRDYYVGLYGEEPWNQTLEDGTTVGAYAKEQLLTDTVSTLLLASHAEDYGLVMTDEMKAQFADSAQDYISSVGSAIAEQFGLSAPAIARIYQKQELSSQVYFAMMDDITAQLKADETTASLSDEAFEKAVMERYLEQIDQWKQETEVTTTPEWDAIVIGSVG